MNALKEKEKLMKELQQSIEQAASNLILLNQNMESVLSLGKDFGPLSSAWKSFSDSWSTIDMPSSLLAQSRETLSESTLNESSSLK